MGRAELLRNAFPECTTLMAVYFNQCLLAVACCCKKREGTMQQEQPEQLEFSGKLDVEAARQTRQGRAEFLRKSLPECTALMAVYFAC